MNHRQLTDSISFGWLALAPMAGITDKPYRQLAKQFGANWTVSEMITDDPSLRHTRKTLNRSNHTDENGTIVIQIAGSNPQQLADAAIYNVDNGAQVIDINMGCPAKKVCNVLAGSALLQNEQLVEQILKTVVNAVSVPVTLKTRLGWNDNNKNISTIAKIAEQSGIRALAIHGRTRTQMYNGTAEYDLIAKVKQQVNIPIWVNGDINTPQKAKYVLKHTSADGIMIGRGSHGQPWLFSDIIYFLKHNQLPPPPSCQQAINTALTHLQSIHHFYGENMGVRIARKHIGYYLQYLPNSQNIKKHINQITHAYEQYDTFSTFLHTATAHLHHWKRSYDIA